ncbi:hypothetical protein ACFWPA_16000 [Rhodococcus sp. NPDC058505]|uniref:hypothetical protein n=1 Tax=unclassified Rhodococcus (in: high G+C Gram-positive bacteria) TaxID=192944 RepID=UPI0036569A4A
MIEVVRRFVACAAIGACSVLTPVTAAATAVTVPFQINPAPFGNPYGSLDVPTIRCVAVVGEQPGTVRITGPDEGWWKCLRPGDVQWLNLSSGAAGSAPMSTGADGYPEAVLPTGPGRVVLVATSGAGPYTPGVATVHVP